MHLTFSNRPDLLLSDTTERCSSVLNAGSNSVTETRQGEPVMTRLDISMDSHPLFTQTNRDPTGPQSAAAERPSNGSLDTGRLLSPLFPNHLSPSHAEQSVQPRVAQEQLSSSVRDKEEYVIPLHKVNWEHHGPWSWASVCSPPGIRWVCQKTGHDEFGEVASDLMKTWGKSLKLSRFQSFAERCQEPDSDLALKLTGGTHQLSPSFAGLSAYEALSILRTCAGVHVWRASSPNV